MAEKKTSQRPAAVTVAGGIALFAVFGYSVIAAIFLWDAGLFQRGQDVVLLSGRALTPQGRELISAAVDVIAASVFIILAIGILRMLPWAWTGFMASAALLLFINLVRYFNDEPRYLMKLLLVVVVFILNQTQVREVFGVRGHDASK